MPGASPLALAGKGAGSILATGLGAVGLVGDLLGGFAQAQAIKRQTEFQQALFARRAAISRSAARAEAERRRRLAVRNRGRLLSGFAGSGVLVDAGTPLDVLLDQALEDELSVQQALFEGEVQATESESSAAAAQFEGDSLTTKSIIGTGTSFAKNASTLITRIA